MVFFLQKDWPKAIENYEEAAWPSPTRLTLSFTWRRPITKLPAARSRNQIHRPRSPASSRTIPDICQVYGEYLTDRMDRSNDGLKWLTKARSLSPGLPRIDFDIGMAQFGPKRPA